MNNQYLIEDKILEIIRNISEIKIEIENFRCFKKREFSFLKGINLLSGRSGLGKTTIFESILYCLYGNLQNIKPINNKNIKNIKTKVKLTFISPNDYFSIFREGKYVEISFKNEKDKNKDCKKWLIEELFGKKSFFILTCYIIQKTNLNIEKVLNENFEKIVLRKLNLNIDKVISKIKELEENLEKLRSNIRDHRIEIIGFITNIRKKYYNEIIKDLNLLRIEELNSVKIEKLDLIINEKKNKIEKINDHIEENLKEKIIIKELKKSKENLKEYIRIYKNLRKINKKYSESVIKLKDKKNKIEILKNFINIYNKTFDIYKENIIYEIENDINKNIKYLFNNDIQCKIEVKNDNKRNLLIKKIKNGNIIKNISGGEFNGILISFIKKLCEFNNFPVLILDEVISFLDENSRRKCNELLKEIKNKIIILVCHSEIEGYYDNIVNI